MPGRYNNNPNMYYAAGALDYAGPIEIRGANEMKMRKGWGVAGDLRRTRAPHTHAGRRAHARSRDQEAEASGPDAHTHKCIIDLWPEAHTGRSVGRSVGRCASQPAASGAYYYCFVCRARATR